MSIFHCDENLNMLAAKQAAQKLNKQSISLSSSEGQLITFALSITASKKVIEIGTLTGYSALWIHRALPENGELWTIERDPAHAAAARKIFKEIANDGAAVHLIEGDAKEELARLEPLGPFDAVFIDGNKGAYLEYLTWSEAWVKPKGLIILDNLFLGGALSNPEYKGKFSKRVIAQMRKVVERIQSPEHYKVYVLQGRDGLAIAQKLF